LYNEQHKAYYSFRIVNGEVGSKQPHRTQTEAEERCREKNAERLTWTAEEHALADMTDDEFLALLKSL
jgi:hypothetical protein